MSDHMDAEQDAEQLDPVLKVFQYLAEKITALEEKVNGLESLVIDEIIGGVKKLYTENERGRTKEELKGKYGDLFDPLQPSLEALDVGDIYEKLTDILDELKGQEGYTDEAGDSKIKEIASILQGKINKIKGIEEKPAEAPAVEVNEEPKGVEVTTIGVTGEGDEGEDPIKKMVDKLKRDPRMKGV